MSTVMKLCIVGSKRVSSIKKGMKRYVVVCVYQTLVKMKSSVVSSTGRD